jgi:hypothetical protein
MTKFILYVACAIVVFSFISCSDSSGDLGLSLQQSDDAILLGTDTFHVNTSSIITGAYSEGSPMACSSDSLLLGNFTYSTNPFGTVRGEILAQFTAPTTFSFPAGSKTKADSLTLTLVFNTWKGYKHSPIQIAAYEMDNGTLSYNTTYYTNHDPTEFCSKSKLLGTRISVAVPDTISDTTSYQPHLTYKFSSDMVKNFSDACKAGKFSSQSAFSNFFKGIYLRSEYGDGAIWNISYLYMTLYYHYHAFVANKDTTLTNGLVFPASKDVRQIALISHDEYANTLTTIPDTVTYITAPAGIYTQVNLPVGRILNKAKERFGSKVINFNHAGMRVEVTNRDTLNANALTPPNTLMLTRKSGLLNYFKNYNYAKDTIMTASYNSTTHSYSFDLSTYLTAKLHKYFTNTASIPETYEEEMVLVPIETTTSSSTITAIRQQATLSGAQIRNKNCPKGNLRINVFYNGF